MKQIDKTVFVAKDVNMFHVFAAVDGNRFDTYDECLNHEHNLFVDKIRSTKLDLTGNIKFINHADLIKFLSLNQDVLSEILRVFRDTDLSVMYIKSTSSNLK